MISIPWELYSEEEVQEVLELLFSQRGYDVYNLHKVDRGGEVGVDLECTRKGETEKLLVAVKKCPRSKDVPQLRMLASHDVKTKIYVYIKEPSSRFKKEIHNLVNKVSFWDSSKLTSELFNTNLRLYLFLIVENYFEKELFDITMSFCKIYINLKKKEPKLTPIKADLEMLNLLWNAKDRSASLHKSLRTLQCFFEEVDFSMIDEGTKRSIINAFFMSLSQLQKGSWRPLKQLFLKFIRKYPSNFERFCVETADRSNWLYFLTNLPKLSPGYLTRTFREAQQEYLKLKDFLDKMNTKGSMEKEHLGEILGDISRILANGAFYLEETVDYLLSIGLLGTWDAMSDKFPKDIGL